MLRKFPPAVYECCLPFGDGNQPASGINHECEISQRQTDDFAPPFPAWPEIQSRWSWYCLPGLWRASFAREPSYKDVLVSAIPKNYWKDPDEYDSKYIQEALSLLNMFYYGVTSLEHNVYLAEEFCKFFISSLKKLHPDVLNIFVRSEIVNRYKDMTHSGEEYAFGYLHELMHRQALSCQIYSALLQNQQVSRVHSLLQRIAQDPEITSKTIEKLWKEWEITHEHFRHLVKKFERFEEVCATAVSIRWLPPEISQSIRKKLEENWFEHHPLFLADYGFLSEILEDKNSEIYIKNLYLILEIATILADCRDDVTAFPEATGILKAFDFKPQEALFRVYNLVANKISLSHQILLTNAIEAFLTSRPRSYPTIQLWHSKGIVEVESAELLTSAVEEKIFWESLRQQISKHYGFYCPFANRGPSCCGKAQLLKNLWTRLPEEDRKHFTPAICMVN
jgi:hypothetical protein